MSAIIEDAQLLFKKLIVTIVIYLVPVTILVGGLWFVRNFFEREVPVNTTELFNNQP